MFYIWTMPANLKIQLKPSMSEIRNYLVANPIFSLKDSVTQATLQYDNAAHPVERSRIIFALFNANLKCL